VRPLRALALLLCVSTIAVAASGCGGGGGASYSGTKPDAWAATVCGALTAWAQGLQADSRQLSADLSGATDINVVKAKFVSFLEGAESSSGTMVAKVKGAGAPAVKDGAAIQQQLVSGLQAAQASFKRAIGRAKKLSTTDPRAFSKDVAALGKDVQTELNATGEKFQTIGDKYDDKTLNEATSDEPSCQNLKNS
jgi:hypothetical protein